MDKTNLVSRKIYRKTEYTMRETKISKARLLTLGVEKLKNFGFVNVSKANVLNDEVYRYYLKKFLSTMLGQSDATDAHINELFNTMEEIRHEEN